MEDIVKYTDGYLAFLDILGFSNFVKKEENIGDTYRAVKLIKGIQKIINSHPEWECKLAIFSDSIVLTSERNWGSFFLAISFLERSIWNETGLLYRGGICMGKYYHDGNTVFGPALIEAHELEMNAEESRILIAEELVINSGFEYSIYCFRDYDGEFCVNPYAYRIMDYLPIDVETAKKEKLEDTNVANEIIKALSDISDEIKELIWKYQYEFDEIKNRGRIIKKYIWRSIPFNYTCDFLIMHYEELECFENSGQNLSENQKEMISQLKISCEKLVVEYSFM